MNSSMSPTWPIIYAAFILYTTALARITEYPLPTTFQAPATHIPPLITRPFPLEARSVDEVPKYTITYASGSVCGYLSGSVQIPITCENKNRCLWELEAFKFIACELDGETTGIARTKCLAQDEAVDPNLCQDDCVSNTYNLLCTNDTAPYCRTYAYPRGVRDYRCAPTPGTRVSSVEFTYEGQKFPNPIVSTVTDGDRPPTSALSSTSTETKSPPTTNTETESPSTTTAETEPDNNEKGLSGGAIGGIAAGVAGAFLLLGGGIWYYRRKYPRRAQDEVILS